MHKDNPHQISNDEGNACPLKGASGNKERGCNSSQLCTICRRITVVSTNKLQVDISLCDQELDDFFGFL